MFSCNNFFYNMPFAACSIVIDKVRSRVSIESGNQHFDTLFDEKRAECLKLFLLDNFVNQQLSTLQPLNFPECNVTLYFQPTEKENTYILYLLEANEENFYDIIQNSKMDSLGQLAGGIAHDFNNILSIVIGYAKVLEDSLETEEDKGYLEKILRASKKGANLTRQLLAFGKQKIMLDAYEDINVSIKEQVDFCRPLLGKDIEVDFTAFELPLTVKTSPDIFAQIIMNLLINARDAIEEKGCIKVDIKHLQDPDFNEKGCACVSVRDNGCGISDKHIMRIFDPFFTTKDQGQGTGLGLATVKGLIEQLGGSVSVSSDEENGTEFILKFPLSKSVSKKTTNVELTKLSVLKGRTILIAEDEKDIAFLLKKTFERLGMNVLLAHTGNEALFVQDDYEGPIDILLTDIVMPEMHGMHLGRMMNEIRPETHTIYMSGYPGREGFGYKIEVPKDCHILSKPVQMDSLVYLMEKLISGANKEEIDKIYSNLNICSV